MIRALIADDEALSRRLVHQLLERHTDVVVVAECADGEEARAAIADARPDVVFLDIRMPLLSGLDVALARDSVTGPLVVFVSAYDQFALGAFEADALDYLTKPIAEERFDGALARVRDRLQQRADAERFRASNAPAPAYAAHLVTRSGNRDVIIPLDTVDYIEADDVYAAVVARGKRHLVRTALDALEQQLDPAHFARVHRSYIVRLDRVTEVRHDGTNGASLVLAGGVTLPVSRRRRGALRSLIKPLAT